MGEDSFRVGHQSPLPSFADYLAGTSIAAHIDNIHRFIFSVQYQKSGALGSPAALDALASDGYEVLNDLLEASGIHYLHILEAKPRRQGSDGEDEDPLIEFVFSHDWYHCSFRYRNNGFEIVRASSSFADFYAWYSVFMPEAMRIEMTLRQIVQSATGKALRPVQSRSEFVFNFSNFRMQNEVDGRYRNMNVLEAIIPSIPGQGRTMSRPADQELYRLDINVSRREVFGEKARNAWLTVEAPFNKEGRFIVFTAALRNDATEILKDNKVVDIAAFDPDFGEDYRIALIDFLRDSALEGFVWQILRHWKFDTERTL